MIKKMNIITYGCQMNVADSERMAARLETIGYVSTDAFADADLILINTCSVRESAEEKILGKIGELKQFKRLKPSLIIGVTGCMAQKDGDALIKRAPARGGRRSSSRSSDCSNRFIDTSSTSTA